MCGLVELTAWGGGGGGFGCMAYRNNLTDAYVRRWNVEGTVERLMIKREVTGTNGLEAFITALHASAHVRQTIRSAVNSH